MKKGNTCWKVNNWEKKENMWVRKNKWGMMANSWERMGSSACFPPAAGRRESNQGKMGNSEGWKWGTEDC